MFLLEPHGTCAIPGWLHTQRKVTALSALTHNSSYTFMLGYRNWLPRKHTTDIAHPYGTKWRTYTDTTLLALALGAAYSSISASRQGTAVLYYYSKVSQQSLDKLTLQHKSRYIKSYNIGQIVLWTSVLQVFPLLPVLVTQQDTKDKVLNWVHTNRKLTGSAGAGCIQICMQPSRFDRSGLLHWFLQENLNLIGRYSPLLEYNTALEMAASTSCWRDSQLLSL